MRAAARWVSVAAVLTMASAPGSAFAAQFVVTDVTYTHSAATTTDSHYRVGPSPQTPTNWKSPVDYATTGGKAYVRLEVFTKPTTVATRYQICFEATPSYACTDQSPAYTKPGVYEWATELPKFYQFDKVDWSKGIVKAALILKDTSNGKPAPENVGAAVSAMYMPTDLRVTVTIVSPGGVYVPPAPTPADAGVPDSGAPDGGALDASVPDASTGTDASPSPPTNPGDDGVGANDPVPSASSDDSSSGGCAMTPGTVGGASGILFAMLGAVALVARSVRRRRRRSPPTAR